MLYPSDVQDILDFGLHGIAISRYSGCWVGMKAVTDVVESSGSVEIGDARPAIVLPPPSEVPTGLNIRGNDIQPQVQEARLYGHKLYAVQAYVRANPINRIVIDSAQPRIGIVAAGKSYADLRQALLLLGLDEDDAARRGLGAVRGARRHGGGGAWGGGLGRLASGLGWAAGDRRGEQPDELCGLGAP